ncbi:MAG: hypothetical protein JNJ99_11705 [Crocinitomicaceae bacterium]|nr:hypothetical protein [Crocinitomicaceae bacterium]
MSLSISGSLKSGKFCAGYSDTVIFKNDVIYRNNPLPFITGIWFPINQIDSSDQMVFGDFFRDNQMNSTLSPSIGLMVNNLQKLVSGYKMEPDFFIHYKEASKKKMDLALKIIGIQTNSFRSKLPVKEKFPCIVYHHGSGSNPFENYELFELLAQHGYVVISASYMLADSTNQKLVSNHTSQESYAGDIQFITSFVKSISCVDTSKMLLMGHSWGAQAALEFDYFDSIKPYQAIISLQTTLEEVSVSEASGWKYLDFIYQNRSSNCTTPAFLITSVSLRKRKAENSNGFEYRNVQPEYLPFRENKTTPYTFITIGKVLYHHQFVSAGHMRYKIALENGYEDINELKEQYQLYQNLNQTILFLCEQILKGSNSDISDFFREKEFSIEFVNQ